MSDSKYCRYCNERITEYNVEDHICKEEIVFIRKDKDQAYMQYSNMLRQHTRSSRSNKKKRTLAK